MLEEVARRQDPATLSGPSGGQSAVWAVTDGFDPFEGAQQVLDAAGVSFDAGAFAKTPHFTDPNGGDATTARVSQTGVEPAVAADRSPAPEGPLNVADAKTSAVPGLRAAAVVPGRRRRGKATATLRLLVGGQDTTVLVGLRRRGRGRLIPLTTLTGRLGPSETTLALPRLPAGKHKLVVQDAAGARRTLPFRLK